MHHRIAARVLVWWSLLPLTASLLLAACGDDSDTSPSSEADDDHDDDSAVAIDDDNDDNDDDDNDVTLPSITSFVVLDPPLGNPLAREVTVATDAPCSLSAYLTDPKEPGVGFSDPLRSPRLTHHRFWFYGLLADHQYHVTVHLADRPDQVLAEEDFLAPPLPSWVPVPSHVGNAADASREEWIAFGGAWGMALNGFIIVLDWRGRVRMAHDLGFYIPSGLQTLADGTIVYTTNFDLVFVRPNGVAQLFNVQLNRPAYFKAHHQFYVHPTDPFYAWVVFNRFGPGVQCDGETPTLRAIGDGIAELDADGREVWRWDVFHHPAAFPPWDMDEWWCEHHHRFWLTGYDWTHANTVAPHPDPDTMLIAFRNLSEVVKVDRRTGTVLWKMGEGRDFEYVGEHVPPADRWFINLHDPHWLPGNRLLLFDNGNCRYNDDCGHGPWSRALILEVDEDAMTVSPAWEFRVPFSQVKGNVHPMKNGDVLINSAVARELLEVTLASEVVGRLEFSFLVSFGWARPVRAFWDEDARRP